MKKLLINISRFPENEYGEALRTNQKRINNILAEYVKIIWFAITVSPFRCKCIVKCHFE